MLDRLLKSLGRRSPPSPSPAAERSGDAVKPAPVDVSDADFTQVVLASELPVVVDFWADWCSPCTVMSAFVGFLATDYASRLLVAALDVDENPATAARYEVMSLPTLIVFHHGVEVARIVGLLDYEQLKGRIEPWLLEAEA